MRVAVSRGLASLTRRSPGSTLSPLAARLGAPGWSRGAHDAAAGSVPATSSNRSSTGNLHAVQSKVDELLDRNRKWVEEKVEEDATYFERNKVRRNAPAPAARRLRWGQTRCASRTPSVWLLGCLLG